MYRKIGLFANQCIPNPLHTGAGIKPSNILNLQRLFNLQRVKLSFKGLYSQASNNYKDSQVNTVLSIAIANDSFNVKHDQCLYTHIHVCTHTYAHTHTYVHIHKNTHTQTYK